MNRLSALGLLIALGSAGAHAQTVTELLRNGANGDKFNIVIIGDGFAAGADQTAYDTFVQNVVIRDLFSETRNGAYREIMGAFNLFRVNAVSAQSGITTVDSTGAVTNTVNTFLGYRYSGNWNRCWMEPGPNSNTTLANTLDNLVPGWTHAFIILNTTSGGGCRRGNQLAITRGSTWTTAAHEMGHMIGDLGDEYTGTANYTGGEPGKVNLTINTDRATLKWREFVNPSTAVPTTSTTGDPVEDTGLFAGATTGGTRFATGIFRPARNSRMNSNMPEFDSVGYDQMRNVSAQRQDIRYRNVYPGRFTGGAGADLMLHQENSLHLFTGQWDTVASSWVRTMPDPVWDAYRPGDKFLVGDFDGDGREDLYVYNFTDWSMPYFAMLRSTGSGFTGIRRFDQDLPGWGAMREHDEFFVMDVDGDRRDDVVVFNGRDFSIGYLLVLRSTGNNLQFVQRFDDTLPGWDSMKRGDRFYVADFDADGREDLYVSNQTDWSVGYLMMFRSNGRSFSFVRRFDEELPGWDDMKPGDQFFVGDFNADKRDDLYVFNGSDWSMPYLEMLRSTGNNMSNTRRFDRDVPGWGEMRRRDRWFVGDVNGDDRSDLYVFNADDWSTQYLGTLRSTGTNLGGGFQTDWIGSWNLGTVDKFAVANFNGGQGWDDLFVYNDDWFGCLRSLSNSVANTALYPQWIHDHRYHEFGWW